MAEDPARPPTQDPPEDMAQDPAEDPGITQRRARSFGPVAELYDRVRPGYPKEALSWLIPSGARTVVEIGAGTGSLTRSLAALDLQVVAVEPDAEMRKVLARRLPDVDVREGGAEHIPVEDRWADVVLGAQMWHWVDQSRATSEVGRVLRSGGTLGLMWNLRDERVEWMAQLGALFDGDDRHGLDRSEWLVLPKDAPFSEQSWTRFESFQTLRTSELVDLVASRSHVQVLDDAERSAVLDRVREFARSHPALTGRDSVEVPYVTACWRAVRD
jgi:SAM-dependent methyltransferase